MSLREEFVQETPMVVLGIVLAIFFGDGVGRWFEVDERRETVDAVIESIVENRSARAAVGADHDVAKSSAVALLAHSIDRVTLPDSSIASHLLTVTADRTYEPRLGAINSRIASRDLHLIDNDWVVQRISGWPARLKDLTEDEERIRSGSRDIVAFLQETGVPFPGVIHLADSESVSHLLGPAIIDDIPDVHPNVDLIGFSKSRAFENLMTMRLIDLHVVLTEYSEIEAESGELLEALRTYKVGVDARGAKWTAVFWHFITLLTFVLALEVVWQSREGLRRPRRWIGIGLAVAAVAGTVVRLVL